MVYYYACASVEKLLINIWYHQMHRRVKNDQKCCCDYFTLCCKLSAKKKWKKDYIDFDTAIKKLTSLNLKLTNIMVLDNEKRKIRLVKMFLKDQKNNFYIVFFLFVLDYHGLYLMSSEIFCYF